MRVKKLSSRYGEVLQTFSLPTASRQPSPGGRRPPTLYDRYDSSAVFTYSIDSAETSG